MATPKAIASASSSPVAAGAFTDELNQPLTVAGANGYLMLKLALQDFSVATLSGGGQVMATESVKVNLDANGIPASGQSMFTSDQFSSPVNPPFNVYIYNGSSRQVGCIKNAVISGSAPVDLTALTSTATGASFASPVLQNPSDSQTVTQPSGTNFSIAGAGNIVPDVNATEQLGASGKGWKDVIAAGTPWYDARAYGLVGNGATDNTAAWNTMMTALGVQAGNPVIHFPKGDYWFNSKPNSIPNNVTLLGSFSRANNSGYGTMLTANYTESAATSGFITYDGTNAATVGYGGGILGMLIWKASGKTGGVAIKFSGSTDTARASHGFMLNVRISGGGTWNKGIYADGTGLNTSGAQGIRDLQLTNVEVFNTTDTNQSIHAINVVAFQLTNIGVFQGAGSNPGITVTGAAGTTATSQGAAIAGAYIAGNLVLDFANNFSASATTVTGTLSSTANTTASSFHGNAGTYSPTNGLAIYGYDPSGAASQNLGYSQSQRVNNFIIAGPGVPSGAIQGQLNANRSATGGDLTLGSDGNFVARRGTGSGAGSLLSLSWDGATTLLYQWDSLLGFTNLLSSQLQSANAAQWVRGQISELITLSTLGTTTDSAANLLPVNSIIEAVVARVTTTITTATDWKLGDATIAGRFSAASASLASGSTTVGTVQADQTGTSGPRQPSASRLRITTTGTPGAGVIRVTVFYRQFVAPTS